MPPTPKPELAARLAALALVEAGLERRGGFDDALNRPPFAELSPRDRAWSRALAATALRRLGSIDAALAARLQRPPPEAVRAILRLGVAQLLFRETADFAAVDTSVDLAAQYNATRPYKGLVNAVLRGLARDGLAAPSPEADLPPWLAARWRATYGEATTRALALRLAEEPPTDLSLKHPERGPELAAALEGAILPGGSLRAGLRGDPAAWPGFADGAWWVQDAAAAVPARALAAQSGENVLDLCAAPGGKTLQLAAAGARVVALDRSPMRLARLHENLARTGLEAEVVAADATKWADPRRFDAVLLDAPCTATGTFRRHPDVIWGSRPTEVAKLATLQIRLLDAAAERVRPGGRLVYCVCSLEPEEGEMQAAAFLRRAPDFRAAVIAPGAVGAPASSPGPDGAWLRILPSVNEPEGGMDGFFVARFDRVG